MAIVNRLLDVFFRTLDAVDTARERVDRVLGRAPKPEPWATEWSPVPPPAHPQGNGANGASQSARSTVADEVTAPAKRRADTVPPSAAPPTTKPKPASPAAKGKKSGGNRKGSVDRKGADFDSPRARAISEALRSSGGAVVTEDATHEGKKVLARVLWALHASEEAGSELGLTAADASALLATAAKLEVFATNVARTCRDEDHLIEESQPDGRSKRYKLTDQGRKAAAALNTRPID